MLPRILIVEDDELQRTVLRSAFERCGYEVEVASDGLTALRMLRAGGFDLALIDYHLPEIDGFASAQLVHDVMPHEDRPKLIAITAASDSLSSRAITRNVFDAIVSKPLDLPALIGTVSNHLRSTSADQTARASIETWRGLGLAGAPAVVALPNPSPAQAQALRCYFDLSGRREPEAVLLLNTEAADDAVAARSGLNHFVLPFIDLTGKHIGSDAVFSAVDRSTWRSVAGTILDFAERRRAISASILITADLDMRLLAYVSLSAKSFHPTLDFQSRDCVRYPGFFPEGEVRASAERLVSRGLLEKRFFERFHVCGCCGSSRLNVREECPSCRSAHLSQVPLVHHFRCAHQAPEADFARGPHLVCPKCRQHLRHYGSDYDKPGTATSCGDCGCVSSEPAVGFSCLDCGSHTDGEAATTRDVFSYGLTGEGQALLRRGTARLAEPVSSQPPVPQSILTELAAAGSAVALVEIRYGARSRIVSRRGEAGFTAMRRLFIENLANSLDADCMLASSAEADHLLIRSAPPDALAGLGPDLLEACQEVLAEGLEPELRFLEMPAARALIE